MTTDVDYSDLPGADLVDQGLLDLQEGRTTVAALLVAIGAPRLLALGIAVPDPSGGKP